jgi:hypothetical protein
MYQILSKKEIDLMCKLKSIFDPNNILNPEKVVSMRVRDGESPSKGGN